MLFLLLLGWLFGAHGIHLKEKRWKKLFERREWGKIYILVGGISLLFSLRYKDETRPRSFLERENFNESSYRDSGANETWWQNSHTEEERRFISPVCLALFKRKYVSLNGFYLQQLASVVLKSCSEFLFAFDDCGCETSPPSLLFRRGFRKKIP